MELIWSHTKSNVALSQIQILRRLLVGVNWEMSIPIVDRLLLSYPTPLQIKQTFLTVALHVFKNKAYKPQTL